MKCAEIKNQKSELRLSFLNPYLKLIYLVPYTCILSTSLIYIQLNLPFSVSKLFKILILLPFCWQAPYVLQT